MAQPERVRENVVYWRYKGQSKIHQLRYFTATAPEHDEEAARANEEFADAMRLYSGACETGSAVIVSEPGAV